MSIEKQKTVKRLEIKFEIRRWQAKHDPALECASKQQNNNDG